MPQHDDTRPRLLLSLQRALLGAVPAALRQVACGWDGTAITLDFTFDGPIHPDDREAAQIVGAEVISDFPDAWTIRERIVRLDHPGRLGIDPAAPLLAYRRHEPAQPG